MTNRPDYPRRQRSGGGRDYIAPFYPDMSRSGFVPQVPRDRLLGNPLPLVILNATGATLEKGSVVVLTSSGSELAITTSTTQDDIAIFGVTLDRVSAGSRVRVGVFAARVKMRVAAGTTARQYMRQSTTAGVAEGTASPTQGTFGVALEDRDATTGLAEVYFGPHALADQAFATTWYRKTADESVQSSTTYQDDDTFTAMSIAGSSYYAFDARLSVPALAAGNIKMKWVPSGGAVVMRFHAMRIIIGDDVPTISVPFAENDEITADTDIGGLLSSIIYFYGIIENSGAPNLTLKLQWAQNTSNAIATILEKGSYVKLTRLIAL